MTRFNFSPASGLEVGLSWSAMWDGEGQANSVGDLFKVLTFQTECVNGETTCADADPKTDGLIFAEIKYRIN